jgi:hypothetical protein
MINLAGDVPSVSVSRGQMLPVHQCTIRRQLCRGSLGFRNPLYRPTSNWLDAEKEQENMGKTLLCFLEVEDRLLPILEEVEAPYSSKMIERLMDWEDPAHLPARVLAVLSRIQRTTDISRLRQ